MRFDAVVFDLGGVLNEIAGVEPMKALSGIDDEEELWHRWLTCVWVRLFERGRCGPEDFAAGVVEDWAMDLAPVEFLEQFVSWVRGPLPGAHALVEAVRTQVPVACLSNTNTLHWEALSASPFIGLMDKSFLSFQLGMVKPDREVFNHVSAQIGVTGTRLLFLDDNVLNVDAAREAGWSAVKVNGAGEARAALVERGVLVA